MVAINTLFYGVSLALLGARLAHADPRRAVHAGPQSHDVRQSSGAAESDQRRSYRTSVELDDTNHEKGSPAALSRHELAHFGPWESAFLKLVRTKPTLVVWGDKDPYVPSRFAERFDAENVVHLPQAGHWAAVVRSSGECADAVRRFFSETPEPPNGPRIHSRPVRAVRPGRGPAHVRRRRPLPRRIDVRARVRRRDISARRPDSIPDFEREGSRPFVYTRAKSPGKVGRASLSYWRLPERLYDDPEELVVWATRALAIVQRKKTAPRPRARAKKTGKAPRPSKRSAPRRSQPGKYAQMKTLALPRQPNCARGLRRTTANQTASCCASTRRRPA